MWDGRREQCDNRAMTLKRDSEVYRESCIPSSHYLKRDSGEFSRA